MISHGDTPALDQIFKVSIRNNTRDGVTGALALPDGKFVHVIEGPEAAIAGLMTRLRADTRHRDLHVLAEWVVQARLFAGWAMARPDPAPLSEQSFRIVTDNGSGAQVVSVLLGLADHPHKMFAAM